MAQDRDWFEFKTSKKRSYDSQVWLPLRAEYAKESQGEFGYSGFIEEYLSVVVLAVSVDAEAVAIKADANTIRDYSGGAPYVDGNGVYVRAEQATGFYADVDAFRLVLEQSVPGVDYTEWHLNQDLVLGLNLYREGNVWVRVDEGRTQVARLRRDSDGKPLLLEMKVEFLKDYLCARKMGAIVGIFTSRSVVEKNDSDLSWDRPSAFDENDSGHWRWRGDISEIHEGGDQFGAAMSVFLMRRTDYDSDDEAPALEVGGEFESNQWTVPLGFGAKLYRISGELWKTEWITPAASSPRVAGDKTPSTAHFVVGGAGQRVDADNLPQGLVWLWFRPELVASALSYPDGRLQWSTADTGNLRFTPENDLYFGVNDMGYVTVLAVDIERLTRWNQDRWVAFSSSPTGKPSKELIDSQVRVAPAQTRAPENEIESTLSRLGTSIQERYGIPLYFAEIDLGILREANRFTAVDDGGLLTLAKDLCRLFGDRVDAVTLQNKTLATPPKKAYGSLKAVEYTLRTLIGKEDAASVCSTLFGIYDLRLADAHRPTGDLESAYSRANIDRSKPFVLQGYDMLVAFNDTILRIASIVEA